MPLEERLVTEDQLKHSHACKVVALCGHCLDGKQKPDVLFCDDQGDLSIAACVECADLINNEDIEPPMMHNGCAQCYSKSIGIGRFLPGFWLLRDGTYQPQ